MKKDLRQLRVLLIEDNPGDAILVEEHLAEGFKNVEMIHVSTFREARDELTNRDEYDAVLLDLTLPDSDGIDLVGKVLDIADTIPVIVLTGYSNLDFSMESLQKGVSDYLLKDELSSTLLYKSILYSIERNVYSAELKKSEKNYRQLFEVSPVPMWVYDLETLQFLDVNEAAVENYGYSKDEFMEMTIRDIRPQDTMEKLNAAISNIRLHPDDANTGVFQHVKKNGRVIQVEVEGSAIEYKDRQARLVLAEDITEKLKEEQRLKQLELVVTNTTESVVILEPEPGKVHGRRILYINDAFTKMTGYKREEVLGKTLHFLNGPETAHEEIKRLDNAMDNWEICNVEMINYKKDGTPYWIHTSLVPVSDKDGNYIQWVAIGRDISKRKAYEKQLMDSLAEKEVLLSEIHHRVKNNLAVVSSLMQLQAFNTQDKELEEKLYDSVFRISTMASIHEILYQSGSFSKVNFSDIIKKLIHNIEKVLESNKDIEANIEQEQIELNINQAIPCSLMINEVITNAYKHAFRGKEKGEVNIKIHNTDGEITVSIQDNGIGLPDDFDPHDLDSLGLHLIDVLTIQLQGESEFKSSDNGTEFLLRFKKRDISGIGSAKVK